MEWGAGSLAEGLVGGLGEFIDAEELVCWLGRFGVERGLVGRRFVVVEGRSLRPCGPRDWGSTRYFD